MSYTIASIQLYLRETPPGRMAFALGRDGGPGQQMPRLTSPLAHIRIELRGLDGASTWGCAGDRLSVRWLDKRPGRERGQKLRELVRLIYQVRDLYLKQPQFETPFECWHARHPQIMQLGKAAGQEDLTSSFASALFERAVIDGFCRLHNKTFFDMLAAEQIGIEPAQVHPELKGLKFRDTLPSAPRSEFFIRHTVGLDDPLPKTQIPADKRAGDGLPESLAEYLEVDGLRYFKVKVSGNVEFDLERLARIWDVVAAAEEPVVTLDANEAFDELETFGRFVREFEKRLPGLFDHVPYIEQPLVWSLSLDPAIAAPLREVARRKPVIIDEADAQVDAFRRAHALGYYGTSHKNCKGLFKSLLNHALIHAWASQDIEAVLSAEDLQNLPVVPLQQDFCSLGVLDLPHCERNGHHYNYGLSFVSAQDKQNATRRHPDLYERRGDEWFLRIVDGRVRCPSLQVPGLGVHDEPDWSAMEPLDAWVARRFPA